MFLRRLSNRQLFTTACVTLLAAACGDDGAPAEISDAGAASEAGAASSEAGSTAVGTTDEGSSGPNGGSDVLTVGVGVESSSSQDAGVDASESSAVDADASVSLEGTSTEPNATGAASSITSDLSTPGAASSEVATSGRSSEPAATASAEWNSTSDLVTNGTVAETSTDGDTTEATDASDVESTPTDAGVDSDASAVVDDGQLYATGLGTDGVALPDHEIDPHWSVRWSGGEELTAYVQTEATGYEGFWMRPSSSSKFISPFIDTIDPSGSGQFIYSTDFVLESIPNQEYLAVSTANDNQLVAVTVNGHALDDVGAGSYSSFQVLNVPAEHLATGNNVLEFTVGNSGGPTGFRAEFSWIPYTF